MLKKFSNFPTSWLRSVISFGNSTESVSGQQLPKLYLLPIRGYPWHKNEIKRIRSGYYRGNNFQDSKKKKNNRK